MADNQTISAENTQITQVQKKNKPMTKGKLVQPIDGTGTNISNGYINEEYAPKFMGKSKYDIYDKMHNDSAVFRGYRSVETFSVLGDYKVEPYKEGDEEPTSQAKEIAEFVKKALWEKCNLTRQETIRTIKKKRKDGNCVFEFGFRQEDDKLRPVLKYRRAKSIESYETKEGEAGITFEAWVDNGYKNIDIPANKLLMFFFDKDGENYEGVPLYRRIARDREAKNSLQKFQVIRAEKMSVPVVKLITGPTIGEDALAVAIEQAKNIRTFSEGVVNSIVDAEGKVTVDFEFMSGEAGSTDIGLREDISQYEQNILDGFNASFLYLGKSATGSYNQGESDTDIFLKGIQVDTEADLAIINKYLVKILVDFNFNNVEGYPKIVLNSLAKQDLNIYSQSLQRLAQSKLITTDFDTENEVRELYKLSPKKKENVVEEVFPEVGEKVDKPEKKPPKEENDEEDNDFSDNFYFKEISQIINNKSILDMQKSCDSPKQLAELKKKGYKFNEFEDNAPRPLTFAERKINFKSLESNINKYEKRVKDVYEKYALAQKGILIDQLKKAVESNDTQKLSNITASKKLDKALAKELAGIQKDMFELGRITASTEIKTPLSPIKKETKQLIDMQNEAVVASVSGKMENEVKRVATNQINKYGGVISGVPVGAVVGAVETATQLAIQKTLSNINTPYVSGSLNLGRASVAESHPERIASVQYSAVMDTRTTNRCMSLDGRVVKYGSPEYFNYAPPQHANCRSIWVFIDKNETFKPKITGIPSSIPVKNDIFSPEELKNPKILKGSPAKGVIQQEINARKSKNKQYEKDGKYKNRVETNTKKINSLESSIKGK